MGEKQLNFTYAANKHFDAFNRIAYDEANTIKGSHGIDEFKKLSSNCIKNKNIDIFLFDVSVASSPADSIQYIKHLRTIRERMRIIYVAPALKDEVVIDAIIALGVYDIVNPNLSSEDTLTYTQDVTDSINLLIDRPNTFSMVAHHTITRVSSDSVGEKTIEIQSALNDKNIRTYLLYKSKSIKNKISNNLEKGGTFIFAGDAPLNDSDVAKLNLLRIDLLLIEEPTEDELYNAINVAKVLKNKLRIVCFYQDFDAYDKALTAPGAYPIIYDGSYESLERSIRDSFVQKIREATKDAMNGKSKVISLVGQKGGVGRTSLSCLLADTFAKKTSLGLKVCIVDFNVFSGDVSIKYGIEDATPNLYQWIKEIIEKKQDGYTIDLLKNHVRNFTHYIKKNGVYVMPTTYVDLYAYTGYAYTHEVINEALVNTLDSLKDQFDVVILDTTGDTPATDLAILHSSDVLIVTDGTLPGIYQAKSMYSRLCATDTIDHKKLSLVINNVETLGREHELGNIKIAKSFFKGDVYILPHDKKLTKNMDNLNIEAGKKLSAGVLNMCNKLVPLFSNSGKANKLK